MKPFLISAILLMAVLASCNKYSRPYPGDSTRFIYHNKMNETVHFRVYASAEQYRRSEHAYASADIPAGGTYAFSVPYEDHSYWIDWYTQDYLHNNWNRVGNTIGIGGCVIQDEVDEVIDALTIDTPFHLRNMFIRNSDSQTVWHTVCISSGAYLSDAVNSAAQARSLTIKKDLYSTWTNTATQELIYKGDLIINPDARYIWLGFRYGFMPANTTAMLEPKAGQPDTLRITIQDTTYTMVRE